MSPMPTTTDTVESAQVMIEKKNHDIAKLKVVLEYLETEMVKVNQDIGEAGDESRLWESFLENKKAEEDAESNAATQGTGTESSVGEVDERDGEGKIPIKYTADGRSEEIE